jgi:hypothetical protein
VPAACSRVANLAESPIVLDSSSCHSRVLLNTTQCHTGEGKGSVCAGFTVQFRPPCSWLIGSGSERASTLCTSSISRLQRADESNRLLQELARALVASERFLSHCLASPCLPQLLSCSFLQTWRVLWRDHPAFHAATGVLSSASLVACHKSNRDGLCHCM